MQDYLLFLSILGDGRRSAFMTADDVGAGTW